VSQHPYVLVVAASAERSLRRLPEPVAAAVVVEFMVGPLVENRRRVGHPLRRELAGLWSARRGPYCVATRSTTRPTPCRLFASTTDPTSTAHAETAQTHRWMGAEEPVRRVPMYERCMQTWCHRAPLRVAARHGEPPHAEQLDRSRSKGHGRHAASRSDGQRPGPRRPWPAPLVEVGVGPQVAGGCSGSITARVPPTPPQ
jgi:mRNA interferase RelE/StbE